MLVMWMAGLSWCLHRGPLRCTHPCLHTEGLHASFFSTGYFCVCFCGRGTCLLASILTPPSPCLCRDGQVALDVMLTTDGTITTVSGFNSEAASVEVKEAAVITPDGTLSPIPTGYVHVIDRILVPRESTAATLQGPETALLCSPPPQLALAAE